MGCDGRIGRKELGWKRERGKLEGFPMVGNLGREMSGGEEEGVCRDGLVSTLMDLVSKMGSFPQQSWR